MELLSLNSLVCFFVVSAILFFSTPIIKLFLISAQKKLPLPPGSLGWPYIGETFQLYSQNPNVFFASKIKRFGSIFKTHILGCPCVMISSPAAAKFVLLTKAELFKPTFPASKERMLGKQAIFFHQGDYHAKLRRLVLRAFMPAALKNKVANIEAIAMDSLQSWQGRSINTYQEMKTFTFNVALLSIFGKDEILYREDLKRCYYILEKGYNSISKRVTFSRDATTFPASKERMLGKQAIFFHQGDYHAKLRRLVLRAFMPAALKNKVANIEAIAMDSLQSWQGRSINTYQEMKTFTFNVALLSIFGKDEILYREDLKRCYYILEKGYNSMSINIPGTLFHKSMKARKELAQILAKIISTRRESNLDVDHTDLLGSFMGDKEDLTDEQIADNVIGVIFAARDTTASVLTWIMKYLGENPSVLQSVTEEQEAIMRQKEESGELEKALNWEDTKKMPITSRVIQETLRVASILSFTFREAVEDVEYEGYLIPKGWKVLPLFRNIHHSPEIFPDPEKFDPTRFEVAPKPNTYMPFGSGNHSCPGNELAKLEILVILHHLTTKYRWSIVGKENGIQYGPFALPQNGLPIILSSKE